MRIQDFIPPALLEARNRRRAARRFRTGYATYAEARASIGGKAYEDEGLVQVVLARTIAYRDSARNGPIQADRGVLETLAGVAMALQTRGSGPLTVIDFGGACGAHFFGVRAILPGHVALRWHVVETTATARAGRALESEELAFHDRLENALSVADRPDLVYSSGAIQFSPTPYETLRALVACRARYLLLRRLSLTDESHDIFGVQTSLLSENGLGPMPPGFADRECRYPFTFLRRAEVESIVAGSYEIRFRLGEGLSLVQGSGASIPEVGFLAELR